MNWWVAALLWVRLFVPETHECYGGTCPIQASKSAILPNVLHMVLISAEQAPESPKQVEASTAKQGDESILLGSKPVSNSAGQASADKTKGSAKSANDFKLWVTLIVVLLVILGLLQELVSGDLVMLAGLLVLIFANVVPIKEAFSGFADDSILTIAGLLCLGGGLRATGALEYLGRVLLGRPNPRTKLLRLLLPVAVMSAFFSNTALVALFLPLFMQASRKMQKAPSKLLIPLSFATVLGGTCTLIGTSTNFSLNRILLDNHLAPMAMFDITWFGLPITIAGLAYLMMFGQRLLPSHQDLMEYVGSHSREYVIELAVAANCPLVGKQVRKAGLRDLPGLYLFRIERGDEVITPVEPNEVLRVHDVLSFSGVVSNMVELQKIRGLEPIEHQQSAQQQRDAENASLDSFEGLPSNPQLVIPPVRPPATKPRQGRQLCEAVLSHNSPLVRQSVRDVDFRARYNASILAIHRQNERLRQKIGQVILEPGDTLLLDADERFHERHRNSPDFILVSNIEDSAPMLHERAWMALAIIFTVIMGISIFNDHSAIIALSGTVMMVLTRCMNSREAYRDLDLGVVVMLGSAFGISKAMMSSGAAAWLSQMILTFVGSQHQMIALVAFVFLTGLMTELLSNNACAVMMGTIAMELSHAMNIDPRPLMIAVAATSSYGFATPIGYQTNLMVFSAGGYRTRDFFRIGIPLDLICWSMVSLILCSWYGLTSSKLSASEPIQRGTNMSVKLPEDIHSLSQAVNLATKHLDIHLTADFEQKLLHGYVDLTLAEPTKQAAELKLDNRELTIEKVEYSRDGNAFEPTKYTLAKSTPILGSAIAIDLPATGTTKVRVHYRTSSNASGLQWLSPSQTAGKQHPFLFTQSQAIHARSWIPLQDSPSVRVTYSATIKTPVALQAVMSAVRQPESKPGEFHFKLDRPIPPYLIALAVGDLAFEKISDRTGVYAEPSMLKRSAYEFADMEAMVQATESMYGPYRWGRYDVLVLPPSFPFGGMENPCVTFATPTILAGDRSLVSLIAHELAHSWSGNLVTNATWADFWLNEGFTVYIERRIIEKLYGKDRAIREAVLGRQELAKEMTALPSNDRILKINLAGRDPDDNVTSIPYEKGALFLTHLEQVFGREEFDQFIKAYFDHFAFQSITTEQFLTFLKANLFAKNPAKAAQFPMEEWIHQPEIPKSAPEPTSDAFAKLSQQANDWLAGSLKLDTLDTKAWSTQDWLHFLRSAESANAKQMAELDARFKLTASGNSEIIFQWLMMSIKQNYEPANQRLEEFLLNVGRRKFVRPLYEQLVKTPAGKAKAKSIYEKARPMYHPITSNTIDGIMKQTQ